MINLISRPNAVRPGATTTGSIRANVDDSCRYNFGGNIAHVISKTTLTADAGVRHDAVRQEVERLRERPDAGSGRFLEARQPAAAGTVRLRGPADGQLIPPAAPPPACPLCGAIATPRFAPSQGVAS